MIVVTAKLYHKQIASKYNMIFKLAYFTRNFACNYHTQAWLCNMSVRVAGAAAQLFLFFIFYFWAGG